LARTRVGSLSGKVVVVTGASRGVGRGAALALGAEGATVYVTGRTVAPGSHPLPGTIGETAMEVDRRGGRGIAVRVDHAKDDDVAALFDQVHKEQGRLDILVNNAIAFPDGITEPRPFWEKPLSDWAMIDVGMRSYYVAAWHAAKIMSGQGSGLIVGISGHVGVTYSLSVILGVCKTGVDRMARDMAVELKPFNVTSVSLWPGFTFTERAKESLEAKPEMAAKVHAALGNSIEFPGRVIAALAQDPGLIRRSGGTYIGAELAAEYGVTDVDGQIVRSLRAERGAPIWEPIN
jgi:NAD(P)-dependent dehydrogenase (short-subunit alcohol dehydrogenase family)